MKYPINHFQQSKINEMIREIFSFKLRTNCPFLILKNGKTINFFLSQYLILLLRLTYVSCTCIALQSSAPQLVRNVGRQNYDEFLTTFKHVGPNDVRFLGISKLGDYLKLYSPAIRWFISTQTVGFHPDDPTRGIYRLSWKAETENSLPKVKVNFKT